MRWYDGQRKGDGAAAELQNVGLRENSTILFELHPIIVEIYRRGGAAAAGKRPHQDILYNKRAGQSAVTIEALSSFFARRLSDYYGQKGIVPEEKRGFHPQRSTIDTMSIVCRLQELARAGKTPPLHIFYRHSEGIRPRRC